MAILKISDVLSTVVLSHPEHGQIVRVLPGHTANVAVSVALLDAIGDQIKAYAEAGIMTYTVEENPNIPDDVEAGAIEAATYVGNSVRYGCVISPGTTPSDINAFRADLSEGEAYVGADFFYSGPLVDFDADSIGIDLLGNPIAMPYLTLDDDACWVIWILFHGNYVEYITIFGDIVNGVTPVKPTASEITNALGNMGEWVAIAEVEVTRIAGPAITEVITNLRPTPDSFK